MTALLVYKSHNRLFFTSFTVFGLRLRVDNYFWTPSAKTVNHVHLPSSHNPITTQRQKLSSRTAIMVQYSVLTQTPYWSV